MYAGHDKSTGEIRRMCVALYRNDWTLVARHDYDFPAGATWCDGCAVPTLDNGRLNPTDGVTGYSKSSAGHSSVQIPFGGAAGILDFARRKLFALPSRRAAQGMQRLYALPSEWA
jgi:hypothetical protein